MQTHDLDRVTLIEGDALDVLPELAEYDAIVTSPPYADARGDVKSATPNEYVEWISPFLEALLPHVRVGGGFMLNLGRVFRDGVESSYVERTLMRAEDLGWKRIDTVVWGKINGRPVPPYLTNKHEVVYWFTRGDAPAGAYRGYDEVRYPYPEETLLRYQRNWINGTNVKGEESIQEGRTPHEDGARPGSLYVTQVGKEKGIKHPTPMALDLARFLVCLACPRFVCDHCGPLLNPGTGTFQKTMTARICNHSRTSWRPGVVLDPFFGSGTTGVAAKLHGRDCVGIEKDPDFLVETFDRLSQGALPV